LRIKLIVLIVFIFSGLKAQETNTFEYALIEASRQKLIGNLTEAIKLYKSCLAKNPESGAANYELGSIFMGLGEQSTALGYLEAAFDADPDNYWYTLAYTEALKQNAKYKEAVKILKEKSRETGNIRFRIALAENYRLAGKTGKALKIYDEVEEKRGLSEFLILQKADIYKSDNKALKGEQELLKLVRAMPESSEVYILTAEYLEEAGYTDKAMEYYRKSLEIDSMNIFALTNLADYYNTKGDYKEGLSYLYNAFLLDEIEVEKKVNALMYFFTDEELFAKNAEYLEKLIVSLAEKYPDNLGVLTLSYDFYRKIEDSEKAYTYIMRILDQKKDNYMFWQQAVYTASVLEKYDEIIELSEQASEFFPNKNDLQLFVGLAWLQKEEYEKSYQVLNTIYQPGDLSGYNMQVLTFLAESAYKTGNVSQSFQYFETILITEETNYVVMNNYAYYLSLEDTLLERAEELSYKTIKKYPQNPVYLDTYAWILYKMKEFDRALDYIERAYENEKEDPDVLFHYAEILRRNGLMEKALVYFDKAEDAGYDGDEIKSIRNEMVLE
jgi:tetratricopeptide (TPR) repeat protein